MSRIRVYFLVEGFSEENLVNRMLQPQLGGFDIDCFALKVTTQRDKRAGTVFKGGGRSYGKVRNDLQKLATQWCRRTDVWLTTLFDVYDLPQDFPARNESLKLKDDYAKVAALEAAWAADTRTLGTPRFIPHLQLHEFETLLFSKIEALSTLFLEEARAVQHLATSIAQFSNPENINHTDHGAPSKRITRFIPSYQRYKRDDQSGAINVLEAIGLPTIRERCRHFDAWLKKLEQIPLQH
jgi:hypothetical protein